MNLTSKLYAREDEFLEYKPYSFFCGTYNVNGKLPDENLTTWLLVNNSKKPPIDVYAIGFQEIVDLNTTSFLLKSDWLERETMWSEAVKQALTSVAEVKYKFITKIRMYGVFLLVYVNETIANEAVGDVLANYVATGIMDTLGNKGSVAVSMKMFETRLCFVCSHFASDTSKLEKRNSDYRSTRQRLKFEYNASQDYYTLDDHDIVFWFGDFNYRIDNLSVNELFKYLNANELGTLMKFDQLYNERNNNRVFDAYCEGQVNFRPTYKYTIKTDTYECQTSLAAGSPNSVAFGANLAQHLAAEGETSEFAAGKVKLPSWTDRVLWKSPNLKVQLEHYSCVNTLTISDHKPVYALFTAAIKKINAQKFDKIYESLLKESDRRLNEEMPKIAIKSYEFKFGECSFYSTKSLVLEVANEGASRANIDVHFYDEKMLSNLNKPAEEEEEDETSSQGLRANYASGHSNPPSRRPLGQWLKLSPSHIERLEPGASKQIELTVDINKSVLPRLLGSPKAEDFLVLRCMNGNDLFATVSLDYLPTIMGASLRGLSTLGKDETFAKAAKDKQQQFAAIERQLVEFEAKLDDTWLAKLRHLSSQKENQKLLLLQQAESGLTYEQYLQALDELTLTKPQDAARKASLKPPQATGDSPASSVQAGRIELYNMCLASLSMEIIELDSYFHNELSDEYEFLLGHLVKRIEADLLTLPKDSLDDSSASASSSAVAHLSIEEQKSLLLGHLSAKSFQAIEKALFDVELMAEVLYDLLYTLPNGLVPARYFDFCAYTSSSYDDAIKIFGYLPRSHLKLFELIVKFLQLYLKRLRSSSSSSSDSSTNGLIADAIFQVKSSQRSGSGSQDATAISDSSNLSYQSQAARRFLVTFIDNHKQFLSI